MTDERQAGPERCPACGHHNEDHGCTRTGCECHAGFALAVAQVPAPETAPPGYAAHGVPAQEERLDLARVKQAITNIAVRHGVVKDPPPPTWSLMHTYGYTTAPATMDAEIAAEYHALGVETKDELNRAPSTATTSGAAIAAPPPSTEAGVAAGQNLDESAVLVPVEPDDFSKRSLHGSDTSYPSVSEGYTGVKTKDEGAG